jgi:hypothetical protein
VSKRKAENGFNKTLFNESKRQNLKIQALLPRFSTVFHRLVENRVENAKSTKF